MGAFSRSGLKSLLKQYKVDILDVLTNGFLALSLGNVNYRRVSSVSSFARYMTPFCPLTHSCS